MKLYWQPFDQVRCAEVPDDVVVLALGATCPEHENGRISAIDFRDGTFDCVRHRGDVRVTDGKHRLPAKIVQTTSDGTLEVLDCHGVVLDVIAGEPA